MSVVVVGLNHRTAPLALLERASVSPQRLGKALIDLRSRTSVSEAVVLSTCNRTEVYVVAERFHPAFAEVRDLLATLADVTPDRLNDHLYMHHDADAVRHLFTVASGIDSAVLGESEILGQVRAAWEHAQDEQAARSGLNLLFRHALEAGKRARTETAIGRSTTSVSRAAVEMAAEVLGDLVGRRVLVLGAGEVGEGMASALAQAGVGEMLVANRTTARANALAARVGGRAVGLIDLPVALASADVLLTCTGAEHAVLTRDDIVEVMDLRDGRPLLIVDVAVPRDVDPASGSVAGVTRLDLDDLRRFAARGVAERQGEVAAVQAIIDAEVERYVGVASARETAPLVGALWERGEATRASEMERFRSRLAGLDEREREAVEALTRGIVAKLLHAPTAEVKDAAGTPEGQRLASALRQLFDL
jgi:glutamyl-tRNA reductase